MEVELRIWNVIEIDVEEIYRIYIEVIKKKCFICYGVEDVFVWVVRQEKVKYLFFIVVNEIIVVEIVQSRRVVGFGYLIVDIGVDFDEIVDGKVMQIRGFFVDFDCGVKGVGIVLVKEFENRVKEFGVVCVKVNFFLNVVEFYKKCGFFVFDIMCYQILEQFCL